MCTILLVAYFIPNKALTQPYSLYTAPPLPLPMGNY